MWVGMCGALFETLTLFQGKICDFSYPMLDQNSMQYFRSVRMHLSKDDGDDTLKQQIQAKAQRGYVGWRKESSSISKARFLKKMPRSFIRK